VRHGLERWQSKALVERWKNKNFGGIVKDAKYFYGHEAEEADVVLHSAANDGASKVGMLADFVSDDDELEIGVASVFSEFGLERGKRFDDARDVLVWTDAPSIKNERRVDLVTLDDGLTLFWCGVSEGKSFIEGVVNDLDLLLADLKKTLEVLLGEVGDGEQSRGFVHDLAREIEVHDASDAGAGLGAVHVIQQIVDGHDVRAGHGKRAPEGVRDVDEIAFDALDHATEFQVDARGYVSGLEGDRREVGRKFAYLFAKFVDVADEEVFVGEIDAPNGADDVAQVSGNAEIAHPPDIKGYTHEISVNAELRITNGEWKSLTAEDAEDLKAKAKPTAKP